MSGVTLKDFALVDDQEKFTNCPGAAKVGVIVKLDTTGAADMPIAAPTSPSFPAPCAASDVAATCAICEGVRSASGGSSGDQYEQNDRGS